MPTHRVPSSAIFVAIAALAMWFAGAVPLIVDIDLWHEMAYFREVLARGEFFSADPFAFTPTLERVIHHEWGFGALAHGIAQTLGAPGIVALKYGSMAALAAIAWRQARATATVGSLALFAPLAIILCWPALATVRAHLVTLICVAVLLALLARDRAGDRRWIVLYLAMQVVWQNVHGGFVAGIVLLVAHTLEQAVKGRPTRHLLLISTGAIAAIVVNPHGHHYYGYLVRALTMSRPHISEWAPLWSHPSAITFLFAAAWIPIGIALWTRGWRALEGSFPVLLCTVEALLHQRFVTLFAVVAFIHVPGWLSATPFGRRIDTLFERRAFVVRYLAVVVTLAMLAHLAMQHPFALRVPSDPRNSLETGYPVGAVDYLRDQGFRGKLFTSFDDGAYVSWKLHPAVQVSLDSRYEVAYRDGVLEENLTFFHALAGFATIPKQAGADAILIPRRLPVANHLDAIDGFHQVYRDEQHVVLARESSDLPLRVVIEPARDGCFP